jgi:hypothetical protein
MEATHLFARCVMRLEAFTDEDGNYRLQGIPAGCPRV